MPKPSPEKEVYWREMLRRQQRSGLSVRQFCSDEGLSEASFFSWRREIAKRDHKAGSRVAGRSSLQGKPANQAPEPSSAFIPLRLTEDAASAIELMHPRGHVLRIPSGFDRDCLQRVLELLDREGER
jgi:hypothetical protein